MSPTMQNRCSKGSSEDIAVLKQLADKGIKARALSTLLGDDAHSSRVVEFLNSELTRFGARDTETPRVPGTNIKLSDLTAPRSWLDQDENTAIGRGMSFIARIAEDTVPQSYPHVQKRQFKLDFGGGETAIMQVPNTVTLFNDALLRKRYRVDTRVHLKDLVKYEVHGRPVLRFTEASKIDRLKHVSLKDVAATNAKLNANGHRTLFVDAAASAGAGASGGRENAGASASAEAGASGGREDGGPSASALVKRKWRPRPILVKHDDYE